MRATLNLIEGQARAAQHEMAASTRAHWASASWYCRVGVVSKPNVCEVLRRAQAIDLLDNTLLVIEQDNRMVLPQPLKADEATIYIVIIWRRWGRVLWRLLGGRDSALPPVVTYQQIG